MANFLSNIAGVFRQIYTSPLALPLLGIIGWRIYADIFNSQTMISAFGAAFCAAFIFKSKRPLYFYDQNEKLKELINNIDSSGFTESIVQSWHIDKQFLSDRSAVFASIFFSYLFVSNGEGVGGWFTIDGVKQVGLLILLTITLTILTLLIFMSLVVYTYKLTGNLPDSDFDKDSDDMTEHERSRLFEKFKQFVQTHLSLVIAAPAYAMTILVIEQFATTYLKKHGLVPTTSDVSLDVVALASTALISGVILAIVLFSPARRESHGDDEEDGTINDVSTSNRQIDSQVVLLIHGIRTRANWQEMVANVLKVEGTVEVIPIRFGRLDLLRFWLPIFTRRAPIDRVERQIRFALRQYSGAKLSIVAHSFGTYALGRILVENPDIAVYRVVLCGAILPTSYEWARVSPQVEFTVVNDCGSRDIWPIFAESTTFGYGASGTFGFGSVRVRDRFHNSAHGDFFSKEFVTRFWRPFIHYGSIINTKWEISGHPSPLWINIASIVPLKSMAVLTTVGIGIYYYCMRSNTQ